MIVATPSYVTSTLVRDLSPEVSQLSSEIPYASAATVAMAFSRDAVTHPLERLRLRGAAQREDRHHGRLVAVVEVARTARPKDRC